MPLPRRPAAGELRIMGDDTLQEPGANAPRIALGEPFPNLVLPSIEDGKPRSIADFRGQKLALHVFASW